MKTVVDWVNLQFLRGLGLESRMLPTDHGQVHALVGDGGGALGTLVLFHGLSGSATGFRPLVERVLPHVSRIVLPEMLGHGRSEIPALGMNGQRVVRCMQQAMEQLVPEPAVVFGNSLGGYLAIRYACAHPERVRGLFLSSPAGAPMSAVQAKGFVDRFRVLGYRDAIKLVEMGFAQPPKARMLYAWGARSQFDVEPVIQLVESLGPRDMLSPADLSSLHMPIHFAWGTEERILLDQHLAFYQEHLPPQAVKMRPEGWGHTPVAEVPDSVAQHLMALLTDLGPPKSSP